MNGIHRSKNATTVMSERNSPRQYQRASVDDGFVASKETEKTMAPQRVIITGPSLTTIRNGRHVRTDEAMPTCKSLDAGDGHHVRCHSTTPSGASAQPARLTRSQSNDESSTLTHDNGIPQVIHNHNNSTRQPRILCLSPHVSDIQTAGLGWRITFVQSDTEAVEAIQSRAYQVLVVGLGTLSQDPYCSPLIGYAHTAAPNMYRVVYTRQSEILTRRLIQECYESGADAVTWSCKTLMEALHGLHHFQSVVPAGTKIASHQLAIYHPYAPLRRLQERQDQLVCVAQGNTTLRVRELERYSHRLDVQLRQVPPKFIQAVTSHNYHLSSNKKKKSIRLVHVSDTNNHHASLYNIPCGDLFVHTGNIINPNESKSNAVFVFQDFIKWLANVVVPKFEMVVFIAGNHDDILDSVQHVSLREHLQATQTLKEFLHQYPSVRYLENSSVIFHDLVIYGTPTVYSKSLSEHPTDLPQTCHAFELGMDNIGSLRNLDGVDIFLSNRAPSILSVEKDYLLPMDHVYISSGKKEQVKHPPLVHCFGHNNRNFGIGCYKETTVMMNASQELLHRMDPCGGGTPLVMDVPLPADERDNQAKCGPRLFHRHANDHATIEC